METSRPFGEAPPQLPPDRLLPEGYSFDSSDRPIQTSHNFYLVPEWFSRERFAELHRVATQPELTTPSDMIACAERLVKRREPVQFDTATGCWTLPLSAEYDDQGRARYPQLHMPELGLDNYGAHRAALRFIKGASLQKGSQVDHICRRHACCNPYHLEGVTAKENSHRALDARLGCLGVRTLFHGRGDTYGDLNPRFYAEHGRVDHLE